jgi:hypothetical protein
MADVPDYEHGEPPPVANDGPSMHDLVIADLRERKEYGHTKYGTFLQAGNGRRALRDAYDEILDLIVYLRQELAERDSGEKHRIELRDGRFTIQHPLACRPNLFECPLNRAAPDDLAEMPTQHYGIYECWLSDNGHLVLGDRVAV